MTRGVIGVDPGGRCTGFVALDERRLRWWCLVHREGDGMAGHLEEVCGALEDAVAMIGPHVLVAIEDLVEPTPQMGLVTVQALTNTAQVIGALRLRAGRLVGADRVVMVPPAGHGSGPLARYPRELVGPCERKGTGKLRHARSAFDVAQAAHSYAVRAGLPA